MIKKIALLSTMLFFFCSSSAKARENFNLNSITAGEFSEDLNRSGIFNWFSKPGNDDSSEKEWTIMVFINAKNNLEKYGLKDVNEMEMVGSNSKVNIVVELGRMSGFVSSQGDWKGGRRYFIQNDTDTNVITSPVIEEFGKVDMGDWKHLVDFGLWAKKNYPAKKYMLIVWNHGSGWEKNIKSMADRGISYDDETNNHFTTPQLGMALNEIGKIDVYGSDACLMQMVSVAYEIKDNITYIAGSEETEPSDGYAYNKMLEPIVSNPAIAPYEAAKVLVDTYADHYQKLGKAYTQSFVNASALPKFLRLMNGWVRAVIKDNDSNIVISAVLSAQRYRAMCNRDLYHFVSLVSGNAYNADVREKGKILKRYIKNNVVMHNRWGNSLKRDYSNSHGIAIYLPGYSYDRNYRELKWAVDSNWDKFLRWYIKDIFYWWVK